jgi:hypothetical protein
MDDRTPGALTRGKLCCHCLAIETRDGLVLVDTGFGLRDVADHGAEVRIFSGHDPLEYEQLSGRLMGTPVLGRRVPA